jgi:hypothetical protein
MQPLLKLQSYRLRTAFQQAVTVVAKNTELSDRGDRRHVRARDLHDPSGLRATAIPAGSGHSGDDSNRRPRKEVAASVPQPICNDVRSESNTPQPSYSRGRVHPRAAHIESAGVRCRYTEKPAPATAMRLPPLAPDHISISISLFCLL